MELDVNRLASPWLFLGPSGSGKLSTARRWIEEANGIQLTYPLEMRTFSVGDGYEARVFASPYHFEIDIPNLSMQDKQIIGDLLTMFLSSGDVLSSLRSSTRKLVILRRVHSLSLPAAIRVRAVLQQYVLPANASGMIWMTAREITGPMSLFDDIFVQYRVPRISVTDWSRLETIPEFLRTDVAWQKLEGRPERTQQLAKFFSSAEQVQWPRRIQDYYDEMIQQMITGAKRTKTANIDVIEWIRGRVYEALSFCQTGPEIIDSCAAAMTRQVDLLDPPGLFWSIMEVLTDSEPHTSYRTPLSVEWALLRMFEVMRKTFAESSVNAGSLDASSSECLAAQTDSKTEAPAPKTAPRRRTTTGRKTSAGNNLG